MAAVRVQFEPMGQVSVPAPTVQIRADWTAAWGDSDLVAQGCTWAASPSVGSAQLQHRYGYGRNSSDAASAFDVVFRKTAAYQRMWVRIEIPSAAPVLVGGVATSTPMLWHGSIENTRDQVEGLLTRVIGGDATTFDLGLQQFVAHGLEYQLDRETISSSVYEETGGGSTVRTTRALDFNAGNKPNRSKDLIGGSYVFAKQDETDPDWWSTKDVIQYLINYVAPLNYAGATKLPWSTANLAGAPDWDKPVLRQRGRTVRQLLNQLLSRERLLGWHVVVDEAPATDVAKVSIWSYTRTDVATPEGDLAANPRHFKVDADGGAEDTSAAVHRSSLERIDQVRMRGARRRTAFSVGFNEGTLSSGWKAATQIEYQEGGSTFVDYPAVAEARKRRKYDADVRSTEEYRDVFAYYELPEDWDGLADDGAGEKVPVAPDDTDPTDAAKKQPLYLRDLRLLPTLPLQSGRLYRSVGAGDIQITSQRPGLDVNDAEVAPLVFLERARVTSSGSGWTVVAEADKYIEAAKLSQTAWLEDAPADGKQERRWSVSPRVEGRGLRLIVHGAPQHVLGRDTFTALDHDEWIGETDWREIVAAVAIEEDRYCEVLDPDPIPGSNPAQVRRILDVELGDRYRLDYVTPGTPVDVDEKGYLIRLQGGIIRDDRDAMKPLAKLILAYRNVDRHGLTITTARATGVLQIGDYIEDWGLISNLDVESVVTQISYHCPPGTGDSPPAPKLTIQTGYAELDPLAFAEASP